MSNFLFYLASFGLVLGILIVVHELGHYSVARMCGVRVLRFSVGFGRPLISRKFGADATEWAIGAFPLGGYVKMLDEREGAVAPEERHRSFNAQSVGRRIAIVAAGPLANLALAVLVYWGLFWHGTEELKPLLGTPPAASAAAAAGVANGDLVLRVGNQAVATWQEFRWEVLQASLGEAALEEASGRVSLEVKNQRQEISFHSLELSVLRAAGHEGDPLEHLGLVFYRPKIAPVLGKVGEGSIAEAAGLRGGDQILAIGGETVDSWSEVVRKIRASPGQGLDIAYLRQGVSGSVQVIPEAVTERGGLIGRIGVAPKDAGASREAVMTVVRYAPAAAFFRALDETWDKASFSLVMMGKMLTGEVSWRNLSGPVTIADYAGQSARLGVDYYLKFLALVSISLGVLNLLPIPVLDGGHLMYYMIEIIKGGPVSERVMEIGQQIGLALLLMLMAFAFYNDINRLVSG